MKKTKQLNPECYNFNPSSSKLLQQQKKSNIKIIFFIIIILLPISIYFLLNSQLYHMSQLDHLDDRVRFGRLQFNKKFNITVGNIHINTQNKIFNITFNNQQIFVGENQHFLILMQAKSQINQHNNANYAIQDQIIKTCKVQTVQNVLEDQENMKIKLNGTFQDCKGIQYQMELIQINDDSLKIKVKVPSNFNRIYTLFKYQLQNHYFGLGEQFSYLNLGHNKPYSALVRNKGLGRGQQPLTLFSNIRNNGGGSYYTSEAALPIWFSDKKIGYILNDYSYSAWINNKLLVWNNQFQLTWFKKQTYKQIIKEISKYNGYSKNLPDWISKGAILGFDQNSQNITQKYLKLKQAGAKISGVYLNHWVSQNQLRINNGYFQHKKIDQKALKNWKTMKNQFQTDKINILLHLNIIVSKQSQFNKIGEDKNLFVKLNNGQNYKFLNQEKQQFNLLNLNNDQEFKQIISNAIKQTNAKGFMIDFNQAYPIVQNDKSFQQSIKIHNQKSTLYLKKIYQILQRIIGADFNNFLIITKGGSLNSAQYSNTLYTGKHTMNFNFHNGLPSCLTAILSSGLVGHSNTHCDIGGQLHIKNQFIQTQTRTDLLMIRWMQLSAFTSIFKTTQGNIDHSSLQIYSNELLINNFAFYSNVFTILDSYRKRQLSLSNQNKIPLVRPLFVQVQDSNQTYEIQDQFYLGSQIVVAPYLNDDFERQYFLPKGQWRLIWDGRIFKGCNCKRIWKQYLPAAFIRSSSQFADPVLDAINKYKQKYQKYISSLPKQQAQQL